MTAAVARGGVNVRCVDLSQTYHLDGEQVHALTDVRFSVTAGESVALFGPSGSGKSTITALLAGLRRPSHGQVWIGEHELSALPERAILRLRGREIGMVMQNPSGTLLPYASAEDNIRFARRAVPSSLRKQLRPPLDLLRQLGLHELAGRRAAKLSGGEQQRLAVAVAVALAPRLLLADEPTSQLDSASRDRVVEMLTRIAREHGTTTVIVTHDPVVADATHRRITLADGRVVDQGAQAAQPRGPRSSTGRHAAPESHHDRVEIDLAPPAGAFPAPAPVTRRHRAVRAGAVIAESASYSRGGRLILDAVSMRAAPGEAIAVVGPSGSGKSSLLALLAGLEHPDAGTVRRETASAPAGPDGLILQGYGLVSVLTAAENVESPLQADALGPLGRSEIRARAAAALDAVGLASVADHLIEDLSGGQQQRVAIARALVIDPAIVFADELTAELDHEWRSRIVQLVLDVARRGGIVVLATHDPDIAALCDTVVRLIDGRVETSGT